MQTRTAFVIVLAVFASAVLATDVPTLTTTSMILDKPLAQWRLPKRLREISALAMTPDQRLFAVDDEKAVIYQIDFVSGRLVKAFALGKSVLKADFEGLAVVDGSFVLMTSDAVLYSAHEGADGEHVPYEKMNTGLRDQCEFEGLAWDSREERLFLACKGVRKTADTDVLSVFVWDWRQQRLDSAKTIVLPTEAIAQRLQTPDLHPSGIAVHPEDGSLTLVAARERALIRVSAEGELIDAILLPKRVHHPQAEGIEFGTGGRLFIVDEGGGGRARLTVYTDRERQQQ